MFAGATTHNDIQRFRRYAIATSTEGWYKI